ncbi:tRNA lysidine(34) synthetase TilS [bacterium]|nr:MAG: tRNA lysidine(34) synthetase TilS [bacterium]
MPLLNKFRKTIREYNLIDKGDKIVIGVSGGADSVALTLLLKAISKELELSLHIAHLNHNLRGEDSKRDADFVLRLSQRLNLPVSSSEISASDLRQGGSLEEAARKARLGFFFKIAKERKAAKIALGHNLDDQAETVLMRLIRGSGLLGLSGILPKRKMGNFTIIRPLLDVTRSEIERFLKSRRIKPRQDYTNRQEVFFRNRIRRRLLPELSAYNKNIKESLARAACNIAIDYDYILSQGLRSFKRLRRNKAGAKIVFPLARFYKLHLSLQQMCLRLAFKELKADTRRLTHQHIKELMDLAYNRPAGSIVDLPARISAMKNSRQLCLYRRGR